MNCGTGGKGSCTGGGGGVYIGVCSFVSGVFSVTCFSSKLFPNSFSTKFLASTILSYNK